MNFSAPTRSPSRPIRRMRMLSRSGLALVTVLGLFLVSDHCALGAITTGQTSHSPCHGSAAPGKSEQVTCCKGLPATLAKTNSLVAGIGLALPPQSWLSEQVILPRPLNQARSHESDMGPAFSASFAESVLQRSILAHAPPVF